MTTAPRTEMSNPRFAVLALGVLLAAALTAFTGSGSNLPLNSHDVFVARTAEEMMQRGSFIVPYLNDQPRIKKPPLSYWLVIAVDKLNGGDGIITEFEARLPSIIAGIFMVGLTIALGCVMFNQATGLIAGLMLAASMGFVNYTHSARPEMLFAMFCTAGVLGFALSDRAHSAADPHNKTFARLGWLMMGLAILTKGPQLPLPIIVGWVIAMLITGRRDIFSVMRPVSGLLIMAVVSLWWYLALWKSLPSVFDIWQGETVDKYFSSREPKSRYLDPFYLYRTAQLMLPWAAFFFLSAAAPWLKELRTNRPVRSLWWAILLPMIVLSISLSRRDYYMLPVTGALAVLMSAATVEVGRALWNRNRSLWWKLLLALHVFALAAAIIAITVRDIPDMAHPPTWAMIAMVVVAFAALLFIILQRKQSSEERSWWRPADSAFAAALVAGVAFFAAAECNDSLWGHDRIARREFSRQVRTIVPADQPLLGWREIWEIDQYELHRVIPSFAQDKPVIDAIQQHLSQGPCWLLVDFRDDPRRPKLDLPESMKREIVAQATDEDTNDSLQLWRITSSR